jgi:hypothetical protein
MTRDIEIARKVNIIPGRQPEEEDLNNADKET